MKLAETTTIPKLAKASGIPRRTLFRRLMALHAQRPGWMYRVGRAIRINIDGLKAAFPEALRPVDLAGEVEDLKERMGEQEHEARANRVAIGNLAQRMRALEVRGAA